MTFDAFWLPGLDPGRVKAWESRQLQDGAAMRWPVLTGETLGEVVRGLRAARAGTLVRMSVGDIVRAIDAAAARLADTRDPLRRSAEELLPGVTGYSPAMIRLGLERMVPDWRQPALERLIRAELPDPAVLDHFVPDASGSRGWPGRLVRATGPELAFHVFAGNVPGVAVTSIVRSLLVKSATLGKTASGEPLLAPLFARALAQVAPELAGALAVTYWPGGTAELENVVLAHADAVVIYGGKEALAEIRARARPGSLVLDHGPRYSFGIVGREALTSDAAPQLAQDIARAVAIFDQQGCVSPHAVFVERGGEVTPSALAERVAAALEELEMELPRGHITADEAIAIQRDRAAAEFREIGGADVELHAGRGTSYTVVYDGDPAFAPSCLNRFVWIKAVDAMEEVAARVAPFRRLLQTVAVAGAGERLTALAGSLADVGASRITTFSEAPWPPPDWHHDGRGPLRELLRWTDLR